MRRTVAVIRDGKLISLEAPGERPTYGFDNAGAPFVQQDTMDPLKHPVTGEICESKSRYYQINREHGLEVVDGKLSEKRRTPGDRITEEKVLDAIHKSEAILSDPFKRNQWRRMNELLAERNERLINARR